MNHRIDFCPAASCQVDVKSATVGQGANRPGLDTSESSRTDTHGDHGADADGPGSVRNCRAVERHRAVGTTHDSHAPPIVELRHGANERGLPNGK